MFKIAIIGAGPAGLSAALALSEQPDIDITVLELRETIQTLGGAVNLTPLALRYLDSLGAGSLLRPKGSTVSAIELVGQRRGNLLARLWPGVDALRVQRQDLVETLLETAQKKPNITILYGATSIDMQQDDNGVDVSWLRQGKPDRLHVELTIGCDGIHSQVRDLIDPDREKQYAGRCSVYGHAKVTPEQVAEWKRAADGQRLIDDTTLIQNGGDSLLMTFYQPRAKRDSLYLAAVTPVPEPDDKSREGWAVVGADKEGLRKSISAKYATGPMQCVPEILELCDEWFFYPIYMLTPKGKWSKGRLLVIGDAAHAMPPQGESTGVAIEDGVLLAHVLSRKDTRTVPELLGDYESLRRGDIDALYKSTMQRFQSKGPTSWFGLVMWDWLVWGVITWTNWSSDHFSRDVTKLALP